MLINSLETRYEIIENLSQLFHKMFKCDPNIEDRAYLAVLFPVDFSFGARESMEYYEARSGTYDDMKALLNKWKVVWGDILAEWSNIPRGEEVF